MCHLHSNKKNKQKKGNTEQTCNDLVLNVMKQTLTIREIQKDGVGGGGQSRVGETSDP